MPTKPPCAKSILKTGSVREGEDGSAACGVLLGTRVSDVLSGRVTGYGGFFGKLAIQRVSHTSVTKYAVHVTMRSPSHTKS